MSGRIYLDWNATAPLRPEARAAMLAAMDAVGNPSSVHAEGRAARAIVETARTQVAALVGCAPHQIVFTSGATEANAMAFGGVVGRAYFAATEHDSVRVAADHGAMVDRVLDVDPAGLVTAETLSRALGDSFQAIAAPTGVTIVCVAPANGETGVVRDSASVADIARRYGGLAHCDATQAVGRVGFDFTATLANSAAISAHKLGGPKGVGAFAHDDSAAPQPIIPGGGQEEGWRGGTHNVIGVAGFGAAADAARRDLESGVWERVEKLRNILEERISDRSPRTIFAGAAARRLPNTSCFATPGWSGEMQVMQLDLAGFAVSAGSACSSGKVRESHVLKAMGYAAQTASSAIRVSLGPTTTEDEVHRFCDAWIRLYEKRRDKAA